jgi:hypothetical protein
VRAKVVSAAALIVLAGSCVTKADLVFDSGYNTFDDNDPYYDEVWVINDAILDILGGGMGKLELTDYAIANLYAGEMDTLLIKDSTVTNIYGGTLSMFGAGSDSAAYLYAYDVTYHLTGGIKNDGWVEGKYYSNDSAFSFSFYTDTTYSHLTVVPEPSSLILLAFGSLLARKAFKKSARY